jgi:hypothetical protein
MPQWTSWELTLDESDLNGRVTDEDSDERGLATVLVQ